MRFSIFLLAFVLISCTPKAPELPDMKTEEGISTVNTRALEELNTILEVYIRPNFVDTFYDVKPITDSTGIAMATAEIPMDITTLVREALSQVHYKVRHVERYNQEDAIHFQTLDYLHKAQHLQRNQTSLQKRSQADFTIAGNISQFDRSLQSTSDSKSISGSFGGGQGYSNVAVDQGQTSRLSRLGVSFTVYNPNGVSFPGKFGASMEVHYAKDGSDIGFSIGGVGIGYGTEATAMHGRHLALQMMAEFSVVQIVGRTMGVPYWRACEDKQIFKIDKIVISDWKDQYNNLLAKNLLIPFMQSQCIANGIDIHITGILDNYTKEAFRKIIQKYDIKSTSIPSWELYLALELNRILDTTISAKAWMAYINFRNGITPLLHADKKNNPSSRSVPPPPQPKKATPKPAAPAPSSPDYDSALEGLL